MTTPIDSTTLTRRAHTILNGIAFVFDQIESRYDLIHAYLLKYPETPRDEVVLGLAWDIIDWVERLRKLLGHGAGLKKKERWYKDAVARLAPAEVIRGQLQHFDRSIEFCLKNQLSVFGHLSAYVITPDHSGYFGVVAVANRERREGLRDNEVWMETVIDFHPPVDRMILSVGGGNANLTVLHRHLNSMRESFDDYVSRTYGGTNGTPTDATQ